MIRKPGGKGPQIPEETEAEALMMTKSRRVNISTANMARDHLGTQNYTLELHAKDRKR
jgi:hypothetical protein